MQVNEQQLKDVLAEPKEALKLNDEELDAATMAAIRSYGATADPDFVSKLLVLYRHYVTRIHPAQRLTNYQSIVDQVIAGETGVYALMPFVCSDPARPVASAAALDYSVLAPTSEENATLGAIELLNLYERVSLANGLAVLGGLLMTGDRRILDLVKDYCRALDCEEIEILIKCRGTYLTAAVVEFYLEWLEELDSEEDFDNFAAVAAGFANLAIGATDAMVYDIERIIPSTPENAVRILKKWPLPDYAASIAPRLVAIAEREVGEPIIPEVMSIWGLA